MAKKEVVAIVPITVIIDGKKVKAKNGETILDAARQAGIYIPTLCYHPDLSTRGICEVCLVEIEGNKKMQKACQYVIRESLVIRTNTPEIQKAREAIVEHKLKNCPGCSQCFKVGSCELKELALKLGIDLKKFEKQKEKQLKHKIDVTPFIIRDMNLCIQCGRCVAACGDLQNIEIYQYTQEGVSTHKGLGLEDVRCTTCGQCILRCPSGALREKEDIPLVKEALADSRKTVIIQVAPATKVAIGEEFGFEPGTWVTGELVAALHRLGFQGVFDTQFGVDIVAIEYCAELIERKISGQFLPLIDSSCPASVKFIEDFYPELIPYVSTVKAPQTAFGAAAKSYYAEKMGIEPSELVVVSVMPCTAKKYECLRPGMMTNGYYDVDIVITTRELAKMLREANLDLKKMPEEEFDPDLGVSSGAGAIYPVSGGVAECYLRTLEAIYQGENSTKGLEFRSIRGSEYIKEAIYEMGNETIRVLAVHGLANIRKVCEWIKNKEAYYDIIEFLSCPGGCIGGAGQPRPVDYEIRRKRTELKYNEDELKTLRRSYENPFLNEMYDNYIGEPNSSKAKSLFHINYIKAQQEKKKESTRAPSKKDWRRGAYKERQKDKEQSIGSKLENDLERRARENVEPCIRCGNCLIDCVMQLFDNRELEFGEQVDYINGLVFTEKETYKDVPPQLKRGLMECTLCGKCNQYCPEDLDRLGVHLYARTKIGPSLTSRIISPTTFSTMQNQIAKLTTHFSWSQEEKEWFNSLTSYRPADTLLFYGCHSHMKEMPGLAMQLEHMLRDLSIDFTRLGTYQYCCGGMPLYWGLLEDAKRQAAVIEKALNEIKPRQIITMCGHGYDSLKRIVRITSLDIEVKHVVQFLFELIQEKRFNFQPVNSHLTYHDACLVERSDNLYHMPREIIKATGNRLTELPNNKRMASCCGWVIGKWMAYNHRKMLEMHQRLAKDYKTTGAEEIAVSCILCYEIFSRNKDFPKTIHLVDLVAKSLGYPKKE